MARMTAKIQAPTTKNGETIDLTAAPTNDRAFATIEPGYYDAVIGGIEATEYQAGYEQFKNPDNPDGKWTYLKLTPDVRLLNANRTLINRQGFTFGVIKDGAPYRPDGKRDQSPIFGGANGAQYMLTALGLFRKTEDGQFEIDFDPSLISDRVVRVRTAIGGYVKGEKSFDSVQFHELMTRMNGGDQNYSFDDIPALVDAYNRENGYVGENGEEITEGVRLKTKNVIVGWYPINQSQAIENGWYFDTVSKAVFLTEASYNEFVKLNEASEAHEEPGW